MLDFAIPLKPRRLSRDWGRVAALLEATLRSVLWQTDPDFRMLLAVADPPPVALRDPRIEVIEVPPATSEPRRGFRDRRRRILAMAGEVCARGGDIFVPVDADDLPSRRLARFLNTRPHADGFEAPPRGGILESRRDIHRRAPGTRRRAGGRQPPAHPPAGPQPPSLGIGAAAPGAARVVTEWLAPAPRPTWPTAWPWLGPALAALAMPGRRRPKGEPTAAGRWRKRIPEASPRPRGRPSAAPCRPGRVPCLGRGGGRARARRRGGEAWPSWR